MGRSTGKEERRSKPMHPLKLVAAALMIAAVVKELRLPRAQRTWHGLLGGIVPYDLRMPTWARIRHTLWNPEGSIVVGRPFGVGWTLNVGAVAAKLRSLVGAT